MNNSYNQFNPRGNPTPLPVRSPRASITHVVKLERGPLERARDILTEARDSLCESDKVEVKNQMTRLDNMVFWIEKILTTNRNPLTIYKLGVDMELHEADKIARLLDLNHPVAHQYGRSWWSDAHTIYYAMAAIRDIHKISGQHRPGAKIELT